MGAPGGAGQDVGPPGPVRGALAQPGQTEFLVDLGLLADDVHLKARPRQHRLGQLLDGVAEQLDALGLLQWGVRGQLPHRPLCAL